LYLYRARQRVANALVLDGLAIVGIAVGVGLLFASQVASTSLTQSVQRLTGQLVGNAQYQLNARGPAGVEEGMLTEVQRIPGVKIALPVLEAQAQVIGPKGQERSVDLIGTDPQFARFGGPLLRRFNAALARQRVIALPVPIAQEIGVEGFQAMNIQVGARVMPVLLGTTLGQNEIGSLADSPIAVAPVKYAQQLTGMVGRVTRIFVQAGPGRDSQVLTGLRGVAARTHVNLQPAGFDAQLFSVAVSPENQGDTLFSGISAIVGFLFATNAMLITTPRRRRLIEHMRQQGANRHMVLQYLLFDALALGIVACVVGLVLGELLSISVFRSTPGYLSFAFPIGNARIVTWQCVVVAVTAGLVAACVGVLLPLRDLFTRPRWRHAISRRSWVVGRAVLGIAGFAATTLILTFYPQGATLGNITLVVALLCLLPFLFNGVVRLFARVQPILNRPAPRVALIHLRAPATRVRSLAIVATAAVAVFGVVSIQGAQENLQRGLDASAQGIDSGAEIWVSSHGESNAFATTPFVAPGLPARLERLPGVRSVTAYRGSFMDWGDRRLWILAPPSTSQRVIPPSEVASGELALAQSRLRKGGWAVLSRGLAAEHGLHVGEPFVLPSPEPQTFRVAALSTNLGWPPGAVILNSRDYARAWGSDEPSAYEIDLQPQARPAVVREEVQATIGSPTGLEVETVGEREQRHISLARQGLFRLTQIRFLVLIAAMFAIVVALGSLIWQRRGYIAFIRALGFRRPVLQRWLLWEGAILLGLGCWTGALFGVYGQLLISHALASITGFPISFGIEALVALTTFALVSLGAVAMVALAGYFIVRVPPRAARPAS
jgi:putative ABC transport system permease protein